MMTKSTLFRLGLGSLFLAATTLLVSLSSEVHAQKKDEKEKKKAPIVRPPTLVYVFPAGGQRGQTFPVEIHGTDVSEVGEIHISGPGITVKIAGLDPNLKPKQPEEIAREAAKEKKLDFKLIRKIKNRPQNSNEPKTEIVKAMITIAPDAPLGERDLRVSGSNGLSNRIVFVVGQLPEMIETEPNTLPELAQPLPALPMLVNGQIHPGDVDYFRFQAKAGQHLVIEAQGQRLIPFIPEAVPGWIQLDLTLYDAATLRELAYVDDYRIHPDPVMFYKVEKDQELILRVRDALYRGAPKFVYRLSVGTTPFITETFPQGGRRGSKIPVKIKGINLDSDTMTVDLSSVENSVRAGTTSRGLATNQLIFAIDDQEELVETEPNDTLEKAMPIKTNAIVNGKINKPGDLDYFVFEAKAKETWFIEVKARRLESPMDSYLVLYNAKGDVMAFNDDSNDDWEQYLTHQADSRLVFNCPADGKYYLRVSDAARKGGEEYVYRLSLKSPQPDFLLRYAPSNLNLGVGNAGAIKVEAVRRDGFNGEIKINAEGLPPGFTAPPSLIFPGHTEGILAILPPANAAPGLFPFTVVGTAEVNGKPVTRKAIPTEEVQQAFAYFHRLPVREGLLAVAPPTLFTLTSTLPPGQVLEVPKKPQGQQVGQVKLLVNRLEGAKGGIRLTDSVLFKDRGQFLPVRVQGNAGGEEKEATVNITLNNHAVPGQTYHVVISGIFVFDKFEVARSVVIPVKIQEEPKTPAKK